MYPFFVDHESLFAQMHPDFSISIRWSPFINFVDPIEQFGVINRYLGAIINTRMVDNPAPRIVG